MAGTIKHRFQSPVVDGAISTDIKPSHWDDSLVIAGGIEGQIFVRDPASGDGWSFQSFLPIPLTNRTGVTLTLGDVVRVSTAADESAVLDDVLGSLGRFYVAQPQNGGGGGGSGSITNLSTGLFGRSGRMIVKAQGTINRGEYVRK